jgi:hypothetical protein
MTVLTENFLRLRTRQQDLNGITQINFCNCDLSDVSILAQCCRLTTCSLAVNSLTSAQLGVFAALPYLRELSLRGNNIEDLAHGLEMLRNARSLRKLWLSDNPFFQTHKLSEFDYRRMVFSALPHLEMLDNLPYDHVPSPSSHITGMPASAVGSPSKVPVAAPVSSRSPNQQSKFPVNHVQHVADKHVVDQTPPSSSKQSAYASAENRIDDRNRVRAVTDVLRLIQQLDVEDLQLVEEAVQVRMAREAHRANRQYVHNGTPQKGSPARNQADRPVLMGGF